MVQNSRNLVPIKETPGIIGDRISFMISIYQDAYNVHCGKIRSKVYLIHEHSRDIMTLHFQRRLYPLHVKKFSRFLSHLFMGFPYVYDPSSRPQTYPHEN